MYGEKFRFLWIGAPNPRKGYPLITEVSKMIEQMPNAEMYIKTTCQKMNRDESIRNLWKKRRIIAKAPNGKQTIKEMIKRLRANESIADKLQVFGRYKNIYFDTRMLPFDELKALYHSAHCFLFTYLW
jgi:glycosyltransferase involved in cell wall biosynthesis